MVKGVKFSCVMHHCSKKMAECDHAHGQCSKRLRCAESAKGSSGAACFAGMKVSDLTAHEADLLDCTEKKGCMDGFDASSFLETGAKGQVNLEDEIEAKRWGPLNSLADQMMKARTAFLDVEKKLPA